MAHVQDDNKNKDEEDKTKHGVDQRNANDMLNVIVERDVPIDQTTTLQRALAIEQPEENE